MIQIKSCLHKYVPTIEESSGSEDVYVSSTMESVLMPCEILHKILFGGDQLTVACMHGAQAAKTNSVRDWRVLLVKFYKFGYVFLILKLEL